MAIKASPPAKNITVLLLSDVEALYSKIPPARPVNNTNTPKITPSKTLLVISG